MLKTCKQKYLTLNPDSSCYLLCFYWTYAVYLIVGSLSRYADNNPDGDYALFPSFWNINPVKKLNEFFRYMMGIGYTMTGVRSGSINDITAHEEMKFYDVLCRSGHDYANIGSLVEYIFWKDNWQASAGRTLGDWKYPRRRVKCPNLDCLDWDQTTKDNFIMSLFHVTLSHDYFAPGKPLWPFMEACMAVFIMYFAQMRTDILESLVDQHKLENHLLYKNFKTHIQRFSPVLDCFYRYTI